MKMLGYGLTAFAVASVPTAASAADLYDYPPPRAAYIAPPPPPPVYPAYYYGYPRPYRTMPHIRTGDRVSATGTVRIGAPATGAVVVGAIAVGDDAGNHYDCITSLELMTRHRLHKGGVATVPSMPTHLNGLSIPVHKSPTLWANEGHKCSSWTGVQYAFQV